MNPVPSEIGGGRVICFTPIDERHRHTGNTRQIVAGVLQGAAAGLAICHCQFDGDDAFYLIGCDEDWNQVTDTWHQSLAEAQAQAALEYDGVSDTWQFPAEDRHT